MDWTAAYLNGSCDSRTGRNADEYTLLSGQCSSGLHGLLRVDLDDLVDQVEVAVVGHKAGADTYSI